MSASWYDVLGVAPDATEAEIRAAWRGSIEDLDPTDRRFPMYNEAAGVLLDPGKRAAYDAELAAAPAPAEETTTGAPGVAEGADVADTTDVTTPAAGAGPRVPTWLLAALALATALVAGVALWLQLDSDDGAEAEDSLSAARQAAETAVPKVFTYDHRFPDRDRDQGARVLTGDLKAEYEQLWEEAIGPNLEKTQGTAQSEVLGTGAVRGSDDRAEVLVVLKSVTGNKNQTQQLTLALTVTMVEREGRWLIEELDGWDPEAVTDDPASPSPSPTGAGSPSPSPSQ
jgi:Mce-associated membrane protein